MAVDQKQETAKPDDDMFGVNDLGVEYFQAMRQKSRPKMCRVTWAIITGLLVGLAGFLVYQLLTSYFQYQSYDQSTTEWVPTLKLPAISICSTNPFNFTQVAEKLGPEGSVIFNKAMDDLDEFKNDPNMQPTDAFEYVVTSVEKPFGPLPIQFMFHPKKLLFGEYDYVFDRKRYTIDWDSDSKAYPNSTYAQMTELGLCFDLNDNDSLTQKTGGMRAGLTIDLAANSEDYLFTVPTRGFVVFIRDQYEAVLKNNGGYLVGPGTETFIKLSARETTRLGEPHGSCVDIPSPFSKLKEHPQSMRECFQNRRLRVLIEMCRCIPWYQFYRLNTLNMTEELQEHIDKIDELNEAESPPVKQTPGQKRQHKRTTNKDQYQYRCGYLKLIGCDIFLDSLLADGLEVFETCHEPCSYKDWGVEISSVPFPPSEQYFERYIRDQVKKSPAPTYEYIQQNMARVHLYYDDLKVNKIDQTKAYEPQNLIAELGGTLDLFIGISFFTMFQVIEIIVAFCIKFVQKKFEAQERSL